MATPRDVRRLALLALYQIDAHDGADPEAVRESLQDPAGLADEGLVFADGREAFREKDLDRAFEVASAAYEARAAADAEFSALAPDWPVHRLAPIDRAILRLAHYELTRGTTPPKAAVNEAVELAKVFSTEKSPAFVNGLLAKVLRRVQAEGGPGAFGGVGSEG